MEPTIIEAIYHKGVLKPKVKLDLPEDALVQVQVTPVHTEPSVTPSLFGAFPELATLIEEDFRWAKEQIKQ